MVGNRVHRESRLDGAPGWNPILISDDPPLIVLRTEGKAVICEWCVGSYKQHLCGYITQRGGSMLKLVLTVSLLSIFLLACFPPVPGSREYKPISEWEKYAYGKADRNVFPNDVRADVHKYDSLRAAWPGIILKCEPVKNDSGITLNLLIEHHYYDWIEDFGAQHERIFLSPRGEGLFKTKWEIKPDTDLEKARNSVGDMAIVYGLPIGLEDSVVVLGAFYIREIDKQWFATDILDYGRPDEPVWELRVP